MTSPSDLIYMSPEHHWMFEELGYPRLDIKQWPDGEWAILEWHSVPVIPSLTKWQYVLMGIRNTEITFSFVRKYVKQISTFERAFWDREEKKTADMLDEHRRLDEHREDSASRAFDAIRRNPALMERIARHGLQEMNLHKIRRHVPRSKLVRGR